MPRGPRSEVSNEPPPRPPPPRQPQVSDDRPRSVNPTVSTTKTGSSRVPSQTVELEIVDEQIDANTFDVKDDATRGEMWRRVAQELTAKSFCTIASSSCDTDVIKEIHKEIGAADFKFKNLPFTIRVGLLGDRGSAEAADLGEKYGRETGSNLHELCSRASRIIEELCPFALAHDIPFSATTTFQLLKNGTPSAKLINPVTREAAELWTPRFQSTRLTMLCYLGPRDGKLSLRPHYSKNAQPILLTLKPGLITLVRTDLLEAILTGPRDSLSLLTLCINEKFFRPHTKLTPPTMELHDWIFDYLREYKTSLPEDVDFNPYNSDLSKEWQSMMSHNFYGHHVSTVQGQSIKVPSAAESGKWFGATTAGTDLIECIPFSRWDHDLYFDDGPESYRFHKTNCRHAGFCDGLTFFDDRHFGINPAEAKAMAPHQRQVLEVGYEALHDAGFNKRTLSNSSGAHICGFGSLQWNFLAKECEGTYSATGEAAAIMAARLSFCFGMKGNCFVVDTEGSSGLTALNAAIDAIQVKGRQREDAFAVASAVFLNLTPVMWPSQSAAGLLSAKGRCFTFEELADGYVQTDGVAAVCVKRLAPEWDNSSDHNPDLKDGDERYGIITAGVMTHSGAGASLSAPSSSAMQEIVVEALTKAHLYATDIEAVECHGAANLLADAMETQAMQRSLRIGAPKEDPLCLLAAKTGVGQMMHSAGLCAFIKVLFVARGAVFNPTLHLHELNMHVEGVADGPLIINTEPLQASRNLGYHMGTQARGFGGTNVFFLTHGVRKDINTDYYRDNGPLAEDRLLYWPGGGGDLPNEQVPETGYYLMGSHNNWTNEAMQKWSSDLYICAVTLDDSGSTSFQITLDEDYDRVIHPPIWDAEKDTPVLGPTPGEYCHDFCWEIRDVPQARFTVRLEINGAWRKVTWVRTEELPEVTTEVE